MEKAYIEVETDAAFNALQKLFEIISEYSNIKTIEIKKVDTLGEKIVPVFSKLGPEFKENTQVIADELKKTNPQELENSIMSQGYFLLHTEKGTFTIKPEHFAVVKEKTQEGAVPFEHGIARIDTTISEETRKEALVREIERRIQLMRKELQLKKADKISVGYEGDVLLERLIDENLEQIRKEVNAVKIRRGIEQGMPSKQFTIENSIISFQVSKVSEQQEQK